MESIDCVQILELQKSRFSNYYQLNIKTFINGIFDKKYVIDKELINSSLGHLNSNETLDYSNYLNLDFLMEDSERINGLNNLFTNHIVPYTNKILSRSNIKKMIENNEISVLPIIKNKI